MGNIFTTSLWDNGLVSRIYKKHDEDDDDDDGGGGGHLLSANSGPSTEPGTSYVLLN